MARVAVIGAGIAGLAAAWRLQQTGHHAVTLFEAGDYFGGHTHTVPVTLPSPSGQPVTQGVDNMLDLPVLVLGALAGVYVRNVQDRLLVRVQHFEDVVGIGA